MTSDLDEFLQLVGTKEGRVCPQKGCNKQLATMEEALEKEHETAACRHCFRIYIPGENDRSPRMTKRCKKKKRFKNGDIEYYEEQYEDGLQKLLIIPKKH